ncbi:hypothetical protein EPD60_15795 [Flaviaesturariibacter flavus]|uniref:CDP-glycerol--glycerophosphate glycerophosphotransferase n=1 Tax=Flaviaesturariibacter flavus TaxID=2502780 RepID=A0A4R1B840_9BACT|nr:hypothetical protein [Flaviaesturariibacter flavus]TCJ12019.1 hypothetical protein EPD60_15795 [Flaviaesturariibacter flavus]
MLSFFKEYSDSQKLVAQQYDIVFYTEGAYYFQYLRHLFEAFAGRPGLRIAYISSEKSDPVLNTKIQGLDTWYIRKTLLFVWPRLQAKVLISTMPGIGQHGYKRSPGIGRYVYVFHALVSTHQQYRPGAFRYYDALFCCGPDHEAEAGKEDALEGIPPRDLIAYGYPLLEDLRLKDSGQEPCILLAPSWHPEGILNTCLKPLLEQLLQLGLPVQVRPHPEFVKRNPKAMKELEAQVRRNPRLSIDRSAEVFTQLAAARLLVTDRSGIALEYAFARRRPVLFVDTPPKVYNPDFGALGLTPTEDRLRPLLGRSVAPGEIEKAASVAATLLAEAASFAPVLEKLEAETVYGPAYWSNGIAYIESCLS